MASVDLERSLQQSAAEAVHLVFAGRIEELKRLVAHCPEVAACQDESFNESTPLHVAVAEGDEACAWVLLNAYPSCATVRDLEDRLAIHHVGPTTSRDLAHALAAAEPNARDKHGRTALHYAAENMAVDAVNALLAAGADPNVECEDGHTPMSMTTAQAHHDDDDEDELPRSNYLIRQALAARLGEPVCVTADWELEADLDTHDFTVSFFEAPDCQPGCLVKLSLTCLDRDAEEEVDDDTEETTVVEATVQAQLLQANEDNTKWLCFLTETSQLIYDTCPDLMLVKGRELIVPLIHPALPPASNAVELCVQSQ